MKKLILHCAFSPGDIVMLTAGVRDLHVSYPGRFATDVHTPCPELWENNPYLTPLSEAEPRVKRLDCSYPLINRWQKTPHHCLYGFMDFLNDRLGLQIKASAFKGDIHLSAREKAWCSQVQESTGADTPFWIIDAGGKRDLTIKWWDRRRYQKVVDHFRGRILFVQVGRTGDYHPRLRGVLDLRGRTDLRELIRLVYHAEGVLCPVTALMHLAAAVETRPDRPHLRACVVVAGAREPAHWEAYPGHQFIHNNGTLPCCQAGACWRDRTTPLGDGDGRDQPDHLCLKVVRGLPRCMDMVSAAEVIRRIESYYESGSLDYLSAPLKKEAIRGILRMRSNHFDQHPANRWWVSLGRRPDEG